MYVASVKKVILQKIIFGLSKNLVGHNKCSLPRPKCSWTQPKCQTCDIHNCRKPKWLWSLAMAICLLLLLQFRVATNYGFVLWQNSPCPADFIPILFGNSIHDQFWVAAKIYRFDTLKSPIWSRCGQGKPKLKPLASCITMPVGNFCGGSIVSEADDATFHSRWGSRNQYVYVCIYTYIICIAY